MVDEPDIFRDIYAQSHKFDVGEWKSFPKAMVRFGSMLCEDGIFRLPFSLCVFGGGYDFLEQQLVYGDLGNPDDRRNETAIRWNFVRDPEAARHFGFWTKNLAVQAWDLSKFPDFQKATRQRIKEIGEDFNCDFLLGVYADYARQRGWVRIGSIVLDQGGRVFWMPDEKVTDRSDPERRTLENFFLYAKAKAALCGMLAAVASLSSKSTRQTIVPAPERLNRARARKGKPPIYEYRTITVGHAADMPATIGGRAVEGRASPRMHWRRGHYRTLRSNVRVPVAPSLVGCADDGVIDKEYLVRKVQDRRK